MNKNIQKTNERHQFSFLTLLSLGSAIFGMFFGAGNLMYPISVGMTSGSKWIIGLLSFLITAVLLPLFGFITMVLFEGNYKAFFERLGNRIGHIAIGLCMLTIGPVVVIPRIITLSHTMIAPFIPVSFLANPHSLMASACFASIFLFITFLSTYREGSIIALLGNVISPSKLTALVIIISFGLFGSGFVVVNNLSWKTIALSGFFKGYGTLDLLGAIFFSAGTLHMLSHTLGAQASRRSLALLGLKAGILGLSVLAVMYFGLGFLGALYGHGFEALNPGELFREVSLRVVGNAGAFVISVAVFMSCLSTAIALTAVLTEYACRTLFHMSEKKRVRALIVVLLACLPLSIAGLDTVIAITDGPLTFVGYPTLIVLTACNFLYKIFGFTPVKVPVLVTFITTAALCYLWC